MSNPGGITLKAASVRMVKMANEAFHTSESSGTEGRYVSHFKFPSLEAMHRFEDAWTDFNMVLREKLVDEAIARDSSLKAVVAERGVKHVGTDELNRAAAAMEVQASDETAPEDVGPSNESNGPTAEDTERVVEAMETMAASVPVTVRVRVPEEAAEYMDMVSTLCGEDRDTVASVMFAMASLRPGFMEKGSLPTGDGAPPA